MFDHQMSYLIDISKQRRKEYTVAMDYIIRGLTSQEIDFMKKKPPDSSDKAKKKERMDKAEKSNVH
jgi:hypothetical protein